MLTKHLPNILSLSRIVAAPLLIWLLLAGQRDFFLILFLLAAFTDYLDGFIARTFHSESPAGLVFDSIADKVLIASTLVALVLTGSLTISGLFLLLIRDIAIIIATVIILAWKRAPRIITRIPHSKLSKLCTVLQMATVLAFYWHLWPSYFLGATAVVGILTSADYLRFVFGSGVLEEASN